MNPVFDRALWVSRLRERGERPEPLRPTTLRVFGSHSITKQSPPTPLDTGSRKPSAALAATAASTAEPPPRSMSMAARVAKGWAVAAAPCAPQTVEREAKLAPAMRSPAWMSAADGAAADAAVIAGLDAVEAAAATGRVARNVRRRMGSLDCRATILRGSGARPPDVRRYSVWLEDARLTPQTTPPVRCRRDPGSGSGGPRGRRRSAG